MGGGGKSGGSGGYDSMGATPYTGGNVMQNSQWAQAMAQALSQQQGMLMASLGAASPNVIKAGSIPQGIAPGMRQLNPGLGKQGIGSPVDIPDIQRTLLTDDEDEDK